MVSTFRKENNNNNKKNTYDTFYIDLKTLEISEGLFVICYQLVQV